MSEWIETCAVEQSLVDEEGEWRANLFGDREAGADDR